MREGDSYIRAFENKYGRLLVNIEKDREGYSIDSVVFSTKEDLEKILGENEYNGLKVYCTKSRIKDLNGKSIKMYFVRAEVVNKKVVERDKIKTELKKLLKNIQDYIDETYAIKRDPEEEELSYELGVIVNLYRNF